MYGEDLVRQFHLDQTVWPSERVGFVPGFLNILLLQSLQLENVTFKTVIEIVERVSLELLLHHRHWDVGQLDVHLLMTQSAFIWTTLSHPWWNIHPQNAGNLLLFYLRAKFNSRSKAACNVIAHLHQVVVRWWASSGCWWPLSWWWWWFRFYLEHTFSCLASDSICSDSPLPSSLDFAD